MSRYRIKEYDYGTHKKYKIQIRILFVFWYGLGLDEYKATPTYNTLEDAIFVLNSRKKLKFKSKIVYER